MFTQNYFDPNHSKVAVLSGPKLCIFTMSTAQKRLHIKKNKRKYKLLIMSHNNSKTINHLSEWSAAKCILLKQKFK